MNETKELKMKEIFLSKMKELKSNTRTLNLDNITFSDLKKYRSGGGASYLNYLNGPVILKTCKMITPFGISDFQDNEKFAMALQYKDEPKINKIFNVLENFDIFILQEVLKNPSLFKQLGNKNITSDTIDVLYNPIVKSNEDYPSLFKVKIKTYENKPTIFRDEDNNIIDSPDLKEIVKPGYEVKCVFQLDSLWFVGNKFGVVIKALEIKIYPKISEDLTNEQCQIDFNL